MRAAMVNRIDALFARSRAEGGKVFIAYITAGDPEPARTAPISLALERAGVDLIEIGVPFSDPLADGVVNQLAAARALAAGTTLQRVLECVREIREQSQIPIVLYSYMNPIHAFGVERFFDEAAKAGVDGVLPLDLPPEEDTFEPCEPVAVKRIRLIAPTTPPVRIRAIAAKAEGFIYYVSREGVTGEQSSVAASLGEQVAEIRRATELPIAVGFGISNPEQAREVALAADAVVVGSAIVKRIADHGKAPELLEKLDAFVRPIAEAIHAVRPPRSG